MNTATLNSLLTEDEIKSIPAFLNINTDSTVESLTVKDLFYLFPYIYLKEIDATMGGTSVTACMVLDELVVRAIKLNIPIRS